MLDVLRRFKCVSMYVICILYAHNMKIRNLDTVQVLHVYYMRIISFDVIYIYILWMFYVNWSCWNDCAMHVKWFWNDLGAIWAWYIGQTFGWFQHDVWPDVGTSFEHFLDDVGMNLECFRRDRILGCILLGENIAGRGGLRHSNFCFFHQFT